MLEKRIRKILEKGVNLDTRTVDLMDQFEGFTNDTAYVQLVLRNITCINIDGNYEFLSLVVERSKDYKYEGDITFTQLKQGQTGNLDNFLRKNLTKEIIEQYKNKNEEYRFDTPYLFRAQNSTNRSGYGWGYGGTQYGETTAYVFVGAYIGHRKNGFTKEINESLESADLSEFSLNNVSDIPIINDIFKWSVPATPKKNNKIKFLIIIAIAVVLTILTAFLFKVIS